tara:strand:- start:180 stop:476 length:297 start_codon:yes stop_codon:yes gene_type:complete
MIYLELFHGRPIGDDSNPHPRLIGPTFEADSFVSTYGWERLIIEGEGLELEWLDDCVYYDGILYGDFALSSEPPPDAKLQPYNPELTNKPNPQLKENR